MRFKSTVAKAGAARSIIARADKIQRSAKSAMLRKAEEIQANAFQNAAKKSGDMSESIKVLVSRDAGEYEVFVRAHLPGEIYPEIHENWAEFEYKNPTTPGTIPHYLERAFEQVGGRRAIYRSIRSAIRGKGK